MAHWKKQTKHKMKYKQYTFYYDTAEELGRMAFQSGSKMPNPYDPINCDYDEFNEAYIQASDNRANSQLNY